MANKMTKKEWFVEIKAVVEKAEFDEEKKAGMTEFINHEVELLEKKHSKSGQTKNQKENLEIMEKIMAALAEVGKPVTNFRPLPGPTISKLVPAKNKR